LISEGAGKLASVPSGGSGGGGAPAAAAGAAAGGAAAEEEKKEEKEEGMCFEPRAKAYNMVRQLMALVYREGRVRRGYGFRPFRLSVSHSNIFPTITLKVWQILSEAFWEKLCALSIASLGQNLVNRDELIRSLLLRLLDTAKRRASANLNCPLYGIVNGGCSMKIKSLVESAPEDDISTSTTMLPLIMTRNAHDLIT
jgi:hypothetical protein